MERKNKPPTGKHGGEEGNIRGMINEQSFVDILKWLENNKQILGFYQEDKKRKDFFVWAMRKKRCLVLTVEVKSSEYGRDKYNRATEKMKKQGNNTAADLLIVVKNNDNIFTLLDRVAKGIDRTLRELKLS
ncbi:MAG: hypothetical protein ISS88_02260 [Candidatus Portnoybacteria bacterium]|nr:hypothetical protein [Candidatus Portnoybacteria bacterium]